MNSWATVIGIILMVVVFVSPFFFGISKKERIQRKKLKERLQDDQLFDNDTGRKYSVEEGSIDEEELERIKPDSEIEKLYDEERWQLEKIKNELRKRGFKKAEVKEEDIDFLESLQSFFDGPDVYFNCCYEWKSKAKIFLIYFDFANSPSKRETEIQMLLWIETTNIDGHYYCFPNHRENNLFSGIPALNPPLISGYSCYAFEKTGQEEKLPETIRPLKGVTDFEIELKNKDLIVKTNRLINIEDVKQLENIIKTFNAITC